MYESIFRPEKYCENMQKPDDKDNSMRQKKLGCKNMPWKNKPNTTSYTRSTIKSDKIAIGVASQIA